MTPMTEIPEVQRRRIQANFNLLFGDLPVAERAKRLGVSQRSIRRGESEKHAPVVAVARRMKSAIDEAIGYAKMSPSQRAAAQDRERARREARQRMVEPTFGEDGVQKDYPAFMCTALKRMRDGEYENTIDILLDRVKDGEEWKRIPKLLRPYVLETLGFAYHYTGRVEETFETFEKALEATEYDAAKFSMLRQGCWSMLAVSHLRREEYQKGFGVVEQAIGPTREFAPAFYQGLCLAAGTRDPQILAEWMGRSIEAARSTLSYDGLSEFTDRCNSNDPDLQWAQQLERWEQFILGLKSALRSKERRLESPSMLGD